VNYKVDLGEDEFENMLAKEEEEARRSDAGSGGRRSKRQKTE